MVQVPRATIVIVKPETVQAPGVEDVSDTVRRLEAVGATVRVPPTSWSAMGAKVIVCALAATVKLRLTRVAAAYVALPAWSAWMVQVPEAIVVTVPPETV